MSKARREEAALARDKAVKKIRGEFAVLNFNEEKGGAPHVQR